MKKSLLLLSLLTAFLSKAQIINPGLETWTTDTYVPSAMNPNSGNGSTGWWDYNVFNSSFVGGSPISVTRCDTAHGGSYSARIETVVYTTTSWNIYKAWGIPYIGHNYSDTLGILYNGTVNETAATSRPGFPFTQRIQQFNFFYLYRPNGVDTAECRVSLWKSGMLVGGGIYKTTANTGTAWQQGTVNMTYINSLTPDTMYVLYSASSLDRSPKPGSVLWVDDISTATPAGIEQLSVNSEVSVYPNPGKDVFVVSTQRTLHHAQGALYDVNGRMVLSLPQLQDGSRFTVDAGSLPGGIYNLSLTSDEGLANKRLVVAQ